MRRLMLGISQQTLGEALGLTFQQVQKYEKGTNWGSAGRSQQIADFLCCRVALFFEEIPQQSNDKTHSVSTDYVSNFRATEEGLFDYEAVRADREP